MIAYARHVAQLRQPAKDGASRRAHLEAAAARGHARAIELLAEPPFPEPLRPLWEIFERLDSMREVGVNGLCRFTPMHIDASRRLFGWTLAPHEVEALVMLDLVTLYPEADRAGGEPTERQPDPPWPEGKV